MLRMVLSVLAGVLAAGAVVFVGEGLGHMIFPPPPDLDLADPAKVKEMMSRLPTGAIVAVLLAWMAGSLVGGGLAARLARRPLAGLLVAGVMMAAAVATMVAIPHPPWFQIASVPATFLPAWLGGRWLGRPARHPGA